MASSLIVAAMFVAAGGAGAEASLYAAPVHGPGQAQSPINILSHTVETHAHSLVLKGDALLAKADVELHTVKLHPSTRPTVSFDGRAYELLQCHYHTPSEHQIDGVTSAAEKHCVSRGQDTKDFLVIATLYRMGGEDNLLAAALGDEERTAALLDEQTLSSAHYVYHGSLTTAPYTENVTWVIAEDVAMATPEQLVELNTLEGNNARHIHALAGRHIDRDQ